MKSVAAQYTIDQLAQMAGVTTRNIRAHQSRGLLPPPALRGRTGYYTEEHVARLRLVTQMQADGFNLRSIKRVLAATPLGSAPAILDFGRAWRDSWDEEEPELIERGRLMERFRDGDDRLLRLAEKLDLVRHLGGDQYEIPSPTLMRAGEELLKLGIAVESALAVQAELTHHTDGIARTFVNLFVREIWQPFQRAGLPESEWARVNSALEDLRPTALEAVIASFRQSMVRATEKAFGEALERQARSPRRH
jgi:DNA-binding transcriptional MerR regulator